MIFVKPNPNMRLKHPGLPASQTHLPERGAYWPDDAFTHRRIRDGGVIVAQPPDDAPGARHRRRAQPRQAPAWRSGAGSADNSEP